MIMIWIMGIAILWALAVYRCPPKCWLPVTGISLVVITYFSLLSWLSIFILLLLWCLTALVVLIKPLRFYVITQPFLAWFQRENPPLSQAEQQVVDAGGVWWGDQLFTGNPDWSALLNQKPIDLTATEQAFLDTQVTAFCELLDDWKICYQDHDLPEKAWQFIKNHRLWALELDAKYGGHGFSPLAHAMIIRKIATRSISAAITVMVPNSLGPAEFLKHYGTTAQKNEYLPRLANAEEIPCFALTGIEAGSDAASITDTGIVCYDEYQGERVLGLRLNWNKRYITLAPIATLMGLAFQMQDPDHLLGDQTNLGITLALIPTHLPGVEKGPRHFPLNMGFMNGPIRGKNVFVPLDHIIGGTDAAGKGWQMMMECLVVGRGISLPSVSVAMTESCLRTTRAYAQVRQQFHRPIIQFEGIQQVLARIHGFHYLAESMWMNIVQAVQCGHKPAIGSAMTKYHLTELARQTVADSMDVHAGRGIQIGPQNYLSFLHNAVPINITVEGANILTRGLIIYGQGVMRCHPYLRAELKAAMSSDKESFDRVFFQHLGFVLSHLSRLLMYGITGGRFIRVKTTYFQKQCRQLTRMSNALAVLTDITLLVLGKRLKIKEALSARLGDVVSHLYIAISVLKRYQDQGRPADQQAVVDWSMAYCFDKIQTAILEFLANFPKPWLGRLLRRLIFPWGPTYAGPTDQLAQNMIHHLQNGDLFCPGESAQKMEQAMHDLLKAEPLLKKINYGLKKKGASPTATSTNSYLAAHIQVADQAGLLTESEREQLKALADLYWDVIQVDEFSTLGNQL